MGDPLDTCASTTIRGKCNQDHCLDGNASVTKNVAAQRNAQHQELNKSTKKEFENADEPPLPVNARYREENLHYERDPEERDNPAITFPGVYLIIICETFVTIISSVPRYRVIFPDIATVLPS
jgi:hypothetical protein